MINIFDYTAESVYPLLRFKGHTIEGFGLDWSPFKTGCLLSGGFDDAVCIWDLESSVQSND